MNREGLDDYSELEGRILSFLESDHEGQDCRQLLEKSRLDLLCVTKERDNLINKLRKDAEARDQLALKYSAFVESVKIEKLDFEKDIQSLEAVLAGSISRLSESDEVVKVSQARIIELKRLLQEKSIDLQTVVAKRDAQVVEIEDAQQAVEQLKKQLEAKGVELQKVVGERDARTKQKEEAQQAVEHLKKQLEAKGVELQTLEEEFHSLRRKYLRQRGR